MKIFGRKYGIFLLRIKNTELYIYKCIFNVRVNSNQLIFDGYKT